MFVNWKACIVADNKLTRDNDRWYDFRGKEIAALSDIDIGNAKGCCVLIAYRDKNYNGELKYDLLSFTGNRDAGHLDQQLDILLELTTPPLIVPVIKAFGELDFVHTNQGEAVLTLNGIEFATITVSSEDKEDYTIHSDCLTLESLDNLDDLVWDHLGCGSRCEIY